MVCTQVSGGHSGAGDRLYQLNEENEGHQYPHRVHPHLLPLMKISLIAAEFGVIELKELSPLMLDTVPYQLIRG